MVNTEQQEMLEIIGKINEFIIKYKDIRDVFLDLLTKPISKNNLDANELIHIQLYSIKKIINTLEEYEKILNDIYNNPDKDSSETALVTFDNKFMNHMNNLYKNVITELKILKKKFGTN